MCEREGRQTLLASFQLSADSREVRRKAPTDSNIDPAMMQETEFSRVLHSRLSCSSSAAVITGD